jgi:hypothetical protein
MKKLYCYICDYEEWHYCEDGVWYCLECHEPKFVEREGE